MTWDADMFVFTVKIDIDARPHLEPWGTKKIWTNFANSTTSKNVHFQLEHQNMLAIRTIIVYMVMVEVVDCPPNFEEDPQLKTT